MVTNSIDFFYRHRWFRYNAIFVFIFLLMVLFSACSVSKSTYLFKEIKKDTVIKNLQDANVEIVIQKNDLLSIFISSLNPLEDALFNAAALSSSRPGNDGVAAGYLVNLDGNIYFHKLGSIKVEGLTRKALKSLLETALLPYLKDPIVNVSFGNHFITVMGEVTRAQVVNMPEEKITMINAIALSGNIGINGTLKNVLLIRDNGNSKIFKHLNLEDPSIFSSPWYYLQPKDVVVINPNEDKIYKEQTRVRNQQLLSSVLSAVSIAIIVLDRVIKR